VLLVLLAGCGSWPQVTVPGAAEAARLEAPRLVPLAPLLARGSAAVPVAGPPEARVAALRARAVALRAPVVDAATRARMARGVDLSALAAG